jgi:hypothetical protein
MRAGAGFMRRAFFPQPAPGSLQRSDFQIQFYEIFFVFNQFRSV